MRIDIHASVYDCISAIPVEPASNEPGEQEYENDEEDEEYDDAEDYQNDRENKTTTKSERVEVELPRKVAATSTKPTSDAAINTDTTTEKPNQIEGTTVSSTQSTTVRMTAIRSETVPKGAHGKINGKRTKIDFGGSKAKNKADQPDSFVTVTKSISGSLDNGKTPATDDKKFESTYYTKSSTCGYFTFTCNIVYGSNGRSKICRPKTPSNGKC